LKHFKAVVIILLLVSVWFINQNHFVAKVEAWGPVSHVYMTEMALNQSNLNSLTSIINNNKRWFLTGLMFPDVVVIYYYTEFISYQSTHDIGTFYKNLWDDAVNRGSAQAKAFALGVGTHLIQDSVAHNIYIPNKIRGTLIQNNIIHPTVEGILEARLIDEQKPSKAMAETAFDMWNVPFTDSGMNNLKPIDWADGILGKIDNPETPADESFRDEAAIFVGILSGGGFGGSFMGWSFGRQVGMLWDIFRGVSSIIKLAIPRGDADQYTQKAVENTISWYNSDDGSANRLLEFISGVDPTGFANLSAADGFVTIWTYTVLILLSISIFYYYWRKRKPSFG